MNPYEHGEVYVTDDGAETDLDLGHYERFTEINSKKSDNITTGKIYQNIITKERNGDYKGSTVQIIPHVTDEIKKFITSDLTNENSSQRTLQQSLTKDKLHQMIVDVCNSFSEYQIGAKGVTNGSVGIFTENEFNSTINHYKLPEDYSIKSLVPNTSFLFFKNDKVLSEYKTIHIECINTVDVYPEWFWLYTDQCSLGYLIRKHKIKVDTLSDFIFLMDSDFAYKNEDVELGYTQPYYLQMNREIRNIFYNHIWLRKVQYNDDPQLKFEDCKNWISELNLNFPQYSYLVNNIKFN
jgi:hypothetical protein